MKTEQPDDILREMQDILARWDKGELSNFEAVTLVRQFRYRLNRSCWCQETDHPVCCMIHSRHITPHKNCILR